MKREFGSKLIEQVFPRLDLTHVIDTSGAYIPGHGTPTVILYGRHRSPVDVGIRTVMSIKGEPSTPEDPSQGVVWSAILDQIDVVGSESSYISVVDTDRSVFSRHPWSIGGGGATDLLETLADRSVSTLSDLTRVIGRTTHTGEDSVFFVPPHWATRHGLIGNVVPLVEGDCVRDFVAGSAIETLFPYDMNTGEVLTNLPLTLDHHFWKYRRSLKERKDFGNYIEDRGLKWYEHSMFFPERYRSPLGLAFAFVATHNHFALDRGGKVFKQSAPVIKLQPGTSEVVHMGIAGLLNSSVACFWLKQVSFNKGDSTDSSGARTTGDAAFDTYEFAATKIAEFPLIEERPTDIATRLESLVSPTGV